MFDRLFRDHIFPNRSSFNLALAVFAFNLFIICLFALLRAINGMPDPVSQIAGVGQLEDAKVMLTLSGCWAIGNSMLLLGFADAIKVEKS